MRPALASSCTCCARSHRSHWWSRSSRRSRIARVGGYRAVVVATAAGRSGVCLLMANHLTTLFFFPEAFAVLVLGKTYSIAKSALVPRLVDDPGRLVAANAQMSRMSTVGGLLGGLVGVVVLRLVGPPAAVIVAAIGHAGAAVLATRIPRTPPPPPNQVVEVAELTSAPLSLAASAMIVLRFAVGFVTFLLALNLKTASEPAWVYGIVLAVGVVGGLAGYFCRPAGAEARRRGSPLDGFTRGTGSALSARGGSGSPHQRDPRVLRGRRGGDCRAPGVRQHRPTTRP